jgi:hypothetical protein
LAGRDYGATLVAFPEFPAGFAGYADGSALFVNGTYAADVLNHELGHILGLQHARSLEPGSRYSDPLGRPAAEREYGHVFDVMGCGKGPSAHFNAKYKADLGWIGPERIAEGQPGRVYRLLAADRLLPSEGAVAVRVPVGAQGNATIAGSAAGDSAYWLEYRAGLPGLVVQFQGWRRGDDPGALTPRAVWLLHAESGTLTGTVPYLLPFGTEVRDSARGLRFRARAPSGDSSWAEVEIAGPGTSVQVTPSTTAAGNGKSGRCDALGRRHRETPAPLRRGP